MIAQGGRRGKGTARLLEQKPGWITPMRRITG
jgi:hypothetical protein